MHKPLHKLKFNQRVTFDMALAKLDTVPVMIFTDYQDLTLGFCSLHEFQQAKSTIHKASITDFESVPVLPTSPK